MGETEAQDRGELRLAQFVGFAAELQRYRQRRFVRSHRLRLGQQAQDAGWLGLFRRRSHHSPPVF